MDAADQIFIFLICVLAGVVCGPLYEAAYFVRRFARDNRIVVVSLDVVFFLAFAAVSVFTAVLFSFPDFRVYMYIGNLLGLILYLKSVHRIVAFLFQLCYNRIRKVVKRRKSSKNMKKKEVHAE